MIPKVPQESQAEDGAGSARRLFRSNLRLFGELTDGSRDGSLSL